MEINEEGTQNEVDNLEDTVEVAENGNEMENVEDKIDKPTNDMMFDSIDSVIDYYTKYGKQMGFAVSKRTSTKIDGEVRYVTVACSRCGTSKRTPKNTLRPYPTTKTNCQARINALLCADGRWRLNSVVLDHNHPLSPGKSHFNRCSRKMRSHAKRKFELNDRAEKRMNRNYNSFVVEAGGYENLTFLEDCRNSIAKVRGLKLEEGDAIALQLYFKKVQATDSNFFYTMDLDGENRLRNLFWADARCRAAYEEFGDVITFDATYLANKYDMPLALFVGVNHHGQSTLLGCGLICSGYADTFAWLFESWLTCMSGRPPRGIITDEDKEMKNAIEIVFPNTRHRWCLWHIMKKMPEKLRGYEQCEPIKFVFQNVVYDSLTCEEFEASWNKMVEKYELESNAWLTRLYCERSRWVPCFVKDSFWAGMSTTQRSESMHAFFDGYVNSKTTLKQFVEQYENAMRNKVEKENQEDFNSFNSWIPCVTQYSMEKQLQQVYTIAKFREFQEQLTGKMYCDPCLLESHDAISQYEVSEHIFVCDSPRKAKFMVFSTIDEGEKEHEVKCSCRLFEFRGILCKHALSVLLKQDIYSIPPKYIVQRWRKDIKRRHIRTRVTYSDWSVTDEGRRFDRMYNAFHEVVDLATELEEKCNLVINRLHELKGELRTNDGVCGSSQP